MHSTIICTWCFQSKCSWQAAELALEAGEIKNMLSQKIIWYLAETDI